MVAICDAIEAFTAAAVKIDRSAYFHRGANLRYAIERYFYFVAVNDSVLLHAAAQAWAENSPVKHDGMQYGSKLIAPFLSSPDSGKKRPGTPALPLLLRSLRSQLSDRREDVMSLTVENGVRRTARLFLVIQYKFVRFLRPIFDRFENAAFLVVDDAALADRLAQEGLPVVHVLPRTPPPPDDGLSSGVIEFASIAEQLNAILAAFRSISPDCVVIPEGNAPVNEVANQACQRLNIPAICIQQGWSPVVHTGFRNMSYKRMLVWGEGFAEVLRPWNPKQRFQATGHHLIRLKADDGDLSRKTAIGFFPQPGGPLLSDRASEEFIDFIDWTASAFPDRSVLVRDHPSSPLDERDHQRLSAHPNVEFTPPEKTSLDEVLGRCAIAVAIYSTTILEAMAAGTLPLILNFTGLPHFSPNLAADGAAVEVNNPMDARTELTRLMSGGERSAFLDGRKAVVRRYFAADRDRALKSIGDVIASARRR